MIRVACPTCRTQFDVQEAFAGRTAKCSNCGGQIQILAAAPPPVGVPAPPPVPGGVAPFAGRPTGYSGVSIAGFTCGLIGFLFSLLEVIPCIGCWLLPVSIPTTLAGLVCSIIGLVTAKKANRKKGLAIAGLVLSIVAIIWAPLAFFLFLGGLAGLGATAPHMGPPPRF
jgi:tetrahydromethanopterin S-methyltransferase subunit F